MEHIIFWDIMLKLGVIGIGSMGKNHARVCTEIDNIDLVGVADINKISSKQISEQYDTTAYLDYNQLLPKVDAVIISTPTTTHYQLALDALESGKHVLVEKPICDDINKADELVRKAKNEDLVLSVGHIERHNPAVQYVKDALKKQKFGELITMTSKRVSNFPGRIRDAGVIFDLGIHDIDVMHFIAGDVKTVYAKAGKFNKTIQYEDHANIMLNFVSGICCIIEVNWLTPMKVRKMWLTCSKNFVEVDYINQSVTISSSSFKKIDDKNLYHTPIDYDINQVSIKKKEPLKNEIEDFKTAIESRRQPLVTGEDGLMAIKIAEAAMKSYKTGEEVSIT